jgi:hypothetical protein
MTVARHFINNHNASINSDVTSHTLSKYLPAMGPSNGFWSQRAKKLISPPIWLYSLLKELNSRLPDVVLIRNNNE